MGPSSKTSITLPTTCADARCPDAQVINLAPRILCRFSDITTKSLRVLFLFTRTFPALFHTHLTNARVTFPNPNVPPQPSIPQTQAGSVLRHHHKHRRHQNCRRNARGCKIRAQRSTLVRPAEAATAWTMITAMAAIACPTLIATTRYKQPSLLPAAIPLSLLGHSLIAGVLPYAHSLGSFHSAAPTPGE